MPRFAPEPACPSELLSLDLLRPFGLEKPNGFERILAHRIDCQRAEPSCPAERGPNNCVSIRSGTRIVNAILTISTDFLRAEDPAASQPRNPGDDHSASPGHILCTT